MTFWKWNNKINPLLAVLSGIAVIVYGLVTAKSIQCTYFLATVFVLFAIFGCVKQCLHVIPVFIVISGTFAVIAYFATGTWELSFSMFNRFGAICLGMVPGMSSSPVKITRSLSAAHTPRCITLGMLIALSFVPMLSVEIKRVREAMKTRGAGSLWNIKIFYRALLLPFIIRLVNISDTLSLSVETRGFTLAKGPYTVYHKPPFVISDVIFICFLIAAGGAVLFI